MCTYIHTYVHTVHVHTTYILYIHTHTHIYAYMYIHVHVHTCTYYIHTTHTHTHTCTYMYLPSIDTSEILLFIMLSSFIDYTYHKNHHDTKYYYHNDRTYHTSYYNTRTCLWRWLTFCIIKNKYCNKYMYITCLSGDDT